MNRNSSVVYLVLKSTMNYFQGLGIMYRDSVLELEKITTPPYTMRLLQHSGISVASSHNTVFLFTQVIASLTLQNKPVWYVSH